MQSLHSQFLYESNEEILDFGEALAAESDRRRGARIPRRIYFPAGLLYRDVARYTEQVQRYLDLFGRTNVHFVEFDAFTQDTPRVFENVLRFLDVAPGFRCDFRVLNANKRVKSFAIQSFLNNPSNSILTMARWLVPTSLRHALIAQIKRVNTHVQSREKIEGGLRRQLAREFSQEVADLKQLLECDFPSWSDWGAPQNSRAAAGQTTASY
jgi:hypothetical protein